MGAGVGSLRRPPGGARPYSGRRLRSQPQLVNTARLALGPDAERAVLAYIPEVCLARLDAGQADWLAELRTTTVMFASVRGLGSGRSDAVDVLQAVTVAAQRTLMRYAGWLKEITMDDKGTALVAAFGVPPSRTRTTPPGRSRPPLGSRHNSASWGWLPGSDRDRPGVLRPGR